MSFADILILAAILALAGLAAAFYLRRKKAGKGCCGGCQGCQSSGGCKSQKNAHN